MVGRTQAENIANRLAGNEPLGLMESMKEQAQEQVSWQSASRGC